jgi:hypothetical protein
MIIEPIAGESPRYGYTRSSGYPRRRMSRPSLARAVLQIDIRVTAKSPGDVYQKSLDFVSRGRP